MRSDLPTTLVRGLQHETELRSRCQKARQTHARRRNGWQPAAEQAQSISLQLTVVLIKYTGREHNRWTDLLTKSVDITAAPIPPSALGCARTQPQPLAVHDDDLLFLFTLL